MATVSQLSEPDLSSIFDAANRRVKATLNAVNIGIIQSFNASNQTATIQIAIKQVISIDPKSVKTFQEHPLLLQCPVMTLFGGDAFLSMPIQAGDTCILLFNDREIDNWLYNGGVQTPTTPRLHDLSDGIAIVGIRSFQNSIASYLTNGIRLSFAADSRIDLQEDAINSIAQLFSHDGNFRVDGNFYITGRMYGENGGQLLVDTDIIQETGRILKAGNGATGTYNTVTVVDGIVTGGT